MVLPCAIGICYWGGERKKSVTGSEEKCQFNKNVDVNPPLCEHMILSTNTNTHTLERELTILADYIADPVFASLRNKQAESAESNIGTNILTTHIFISRQLFYTDMARQGLFTGGVCLSIAQAARIIIKKKICEFKPDKRLCDHLQSISDP